MPESELNDKESVRGLCHTRFNGRHDICIITPDDEKNEKQGQQLLELYIYLEVTSRSRSKFYRLRA